MRLFISRCNVSKTPISQWYISKDEDDLLNQRCHRNRWTSFYDACKWFYFENPDQKPISRYVWLDTRRCTGFSLVLYCMSHLCSSVNYMFSVCRCDSGISSACRAVFASAWRAKKSGDALRGLTSLIVVSFHHRPYSLITGASSSLWKWCGETEFRITKGFFFFLRKWRFGAPSMFSGVFTVYPWRSVIARLGWWDPQLN